MLRCTKVVIVQLAWTRSISVLGPVRFLQAKWLLRAEHVVVLSPARIILGWVVGGHRAVKNTGGGLHSQGCDLGDFHL